MKTEIRMAPAKINLGLDIVGVREDGYHLLETVFQTISISDCVTVSLTEVPGITLQCTDPTVPCDPRNIAWEAAQWFCEAAGLSCGIQITLEKHIPTQAGMGGGSTDGAAVLTALQKLTRQPLSQERLFRIAAKLGADVPFFLCGGTAYASGVGEALEPLPPFSAKHLVLAKGTQGVSTAEAYAKIDALEHPTHPPVQALRLALLQQKPLLEIAPLCGNQFETVIALDEITQIRAIMQEYGALCSVMTGSGAAVFGLFSTKADAEKACAALKKQTAFAQCCETVSR